MNNFYKTILGIFALFIILSCFAGYSTCPDYYKKNSQPLSYVTVFDPDQSSYFEGAEYIASLVPDETIQHNKTLKLKWRLDRNSDPSISVQCHYQEVKDPVIKTVPKYLTACIFLGQDKPLSEKVTQPGYLNCF